jgi:hypothetical protein
MPEAAACPRAASSGTGGLETFCSYLDAQLGNGPPESALAVERPATIQNEPAAPAGPANEVAATGTGGLPALCCYLTAWLGKAVTAGSLDSAGAEERPGKIEGRREPRELAAPANIPNVMTAAPPRMPELSLLALDTLAVAPAGGDPAVPRGAQASLIPTGGTALEAPGGQAVEPQTGTAAPVEALAANASWMDMTPLADLLQNAPGVPTRTAPEGAPPAGEWAFAARLQPSHPPAPGEASSATQPVSATQSGNRAGTETPSSSAEMATPPAAAASGSSTQTAAPRLAPRNADALPNGVPQAPPNKMAVRASAETRGSSTELPPPDSLAAAAPAAGALRSADAPRATPATAAPPAEPQAQVQPPPPVAHDVSFRLADGQRNVDIRVAERSGEIRVLVQTPDRDLASELRSQLPELTGKLQQSGFLAETWRPAAQTAGQSGHHREGSQGDASGSRRDPREQQRQARRWIGEWNSSLDSQQESRI